MIENNGKQYYTAAEIRDLINDSSTEIHAVWKRLFPKYRNVVLLEQVTRILYEAKNYKKIDIVEFTRDENGIKKYFAFYIVDVIEYIKNREEHRTANCKFIDKE